MAERQEMGADMAGNRRGRPAFAPWMATTNAITRLFLSLGARPDVINLAGGLPAPEVYPVSDIAALASAALTRLGPGALGYSAIEGLPPLRDAIARRYSTSRLKLTRDNVIVTAGSMQLLDLLGKILVDPGEVIVGHYPTYLGAIDAWRPRSPTYRSLYLDPDAPQPFPKLDDAKFVYAVPNFSNPTGALVGTQMRRDLLDAVEASDGWLIEDDPYGALVYDGEPLPSILELSADQSHGQRYHGRVVYLGTLSKTIAPGLRVGWAIAAPDMIEALTLAKQGSDLCTGGVQQAIALEALEGGLVERQAPLITALYRERRDALCHALEKHLAPWFRWRKPSGGMFVWLTGRHAAIDTDKLLTAAFDAGVAFTPSSVFDPTGAMKHSMRMNFTLNPPEILEKGVARLAAAMATLHPL